MRERMRFLLTLMGYFSKYMKRFYAIILTIAVLRMVSIPASAQFFNHASLGVGVGMDGFSFQAGVPMGSLLQLRVGGGFLSGVGYSRTIPNVQFTDTEPVNLDMCAQLSLKSLNAMIDFFPGRKTKFHFTGGLFYGPGHLLSVFNTTPFLEEEDWGSAGIQVGETLITTDDKGIATAYIDADRILPYFGIGAGRASHPDKSVSFVFDIGACYSPKGLGLCAYGTNIKTGQTQYIRLTSADVDGEDQGWIDKVAEYSRFLPMIKFTLYFKMF